MKVSSASTIPLSAGLVARGGAEKPMAPAEGRRRVNAAERRGLRQALALDHRSGVIEPAVLLAQMRHRRLGQRVEGAPATLATEAQRPCERPSRPLLGPRNGDSPGFSPAHGWSFQARPRDGHASPPCSAPPPAKPPSPNAPPRLPLALSASKAAPRCAALKPAIAQSHPEKSSAFIESVLNPHPRLNYTNT
jgi:hypothetical protein